VGGKGLLDRLVVLVVEDEPLVRALTVDALEDEGFEVIEAPTGDQALRVLKARSDVDVVLTDVDMPGSIDGFQLARMARTMFPHVLVIVVSGGVRSGFTGLAPDARFVPKPYTGDLIIRMIYETVGDRPQSVRKS
jgi:CheY-like chemotaxis protein